MLSEKNLGFVGAGQMCEAILSGGLKAGVLLPQNVRLCDIDEARLAYMEKTYGVAAPPGGTATGGLQALVAESDVVVLSIKPQVAAAALAELSGRDLAGKLFLSIMGGVRLETLEGWLPGCPVIRVMPNTPMLVRRGSAGIAQGSHADEGHLALCKELFDAVGSSTLLPERLIDPLTAVSGCGPAFAYLFIEALADGGVQLGLPRQTAQRLAAEMLAGSAEMVLQTGEHPAALKDKVCSPGGGTIVGVHALEAGGFRAAVENAVLDAAHRMEELGKTK